MDRARGTFEWRGEIRVQGEESVAIPRRRLRVADLPPMISPGVIAGFLYCD